MIKAFAARRDTLTQPSVRPAVTEPRADDPEDFRLCKVWNTPVSDSFCRNICKDADRAGITRAQCKPANRPEVKK